MLPLVLFLINIFKVFLKYILRWFNVYSIPKVVISRQFCIFYFAVIPMRCLFKNARRILPNTRAMSAKGPLTDLTVDNEGIATLTMQRLPVNSLNLELMQEIDKALDEVGKNKSKGLIITSVSIIFISNITTCSVVTKNFY